MNQPAHTPIPLSWGCQCGARGEFPRPPWDSCEVTWRRVQYAHLQAAPACKLPQGPYVGQSTNRLPE